MSSKYLLETSREYSLYVCKTRAIPYVADGLKHVQRMALWVLKDRADKMKVVALSGLLSYGRLYVHGDTSSNNAISLLAAPYCNNVPLITGHGAFGSRIAPVEGIGAARYISCARSKAAQAFLYNDSDIVPLEPNYDGSNQEPKHFLPLIPTVLLNGVSGIAVGWSTNLLPHDLKDLIAATKAALTGQPIEPLKPYYEKYDIDVEATGPNQWQLSGKATIVNTSTVQITELPPGMSIESFRKRLITMEEEDRIVSFTDRSTETIDIVVKMKRGTIADWTPADAIEFFKLREKVTERIVVIGWDGQSIKTYENPESLVQDFVTWRLGWFTVRYKKMLADSSYELTYWSAIKSLFDSRFAKKLGTYEDRAGMQADIVAMVARQKIILDETQLDRIVSLATHRWTQTFATEVSEKINTLQTAIAEYQAILASPERLKQVYLDELNRLRSFKP